MWWRRRRRGGVVRTLLEMDPICSGGPASPWAGSPKGREGGEGGDNEGRGLVYP